MEGKDTKSQAPEQANLLEDTSELSFGLMKPEALELGLEAKIRERIGEAGLEIVCEERLPLDYGRFELLYGHIREMRPDVYAPLRDHMLGSEVVALAVSGPYAVRRLLELRGASDPKDALPGTIRGDYAKGEDYGIRRAEGKPSLNIFHAADNADDAQKCLEAFFSDLCAKAHPKL